MYIMRMKFIYISVLVLLMLPCAVSAQDIHWVDYEKGMTMAREQKKPIFLHFSAQWCRYCRKMERETFHKKEVISALNAHFVSIKVDADARKGLARKYQVAGLPDNRFLDKDGKLAYRVPGFMDPLAFGFFLEYIQTEAYKTMDPMTYYQSKKAE